MSDKKQTVSLRNWLGVIANHQNNKRTLEGGKVCGAFYGVPKKRTPNLDASMCSRFEISRVF